MSNYDYSGIEEHEVSTFIIIIIFCLETHFNCVKEVRIISKFISLLPMASEGIYHDESTIIKETPTFNFALTSMVGRLEYRLLQWLGQ